MKTRWEAVEEIRYSTLSTGTFGSIVLEGKPKLKGRRNNIRSPPLGREPIVIYNSPSFYVSFVGIIVRLDRTMLWIDLVIQMEKNLSWFTILRCHVKELIKTEDDSKGNERSLYIV